MRLALVLALVVVALVVVSFDTFTEKMSEPQQAAVLKAYAR
jgi:hypothetical protein